MMIPAQDAIDATSKEEFMAGYAALRRGLRDALWRNRFWPNNLGVHDEEIVAAVNRLMDEYEKAVGLSN